MIFSKKTLFSIIFMSSFFVFAQTVKIQSEKLPVIQSLNGLKSNTVFRNYCDIVESNYKLMSAGSEPEYIFFVYKNTEKFTLQGLAARCNIPYETLATLNRIENSNDKITGKTLILPTVPGLFVSSDKGSNSIEILLQENYNNETLTKNGISYNINGRNYIFLKNGRLTPTERAFFLDPGLRLPLDHDSYWVSSQFGKRKNPLTGIMKDHNGIDLAAPVGTPVYAISDGSVYLTIEGDQTFGNYIILSHNQGKMTSVYAHLSEILVDQYKSVRKGDIIGYVGQSGLATGPHLHFEIRQGGKAENPENRLKFNKEK